MTYAILYQIDDVEVVDTFRVAIADDNTLKGKLRRIKRFNNIYRLRVYPLGAAISKYNIG